MKRILILLAAVGAATLPGPTRAQVGKQVEVTKAYVPTVARAPKLAVRPDMTDTVRMRPEIDYRIQPLALSTNLSTRPIRPATVTYWEFNRPLPFYLRLGGGYPANSALDFYASTQQAGIGYALLYANHEGWWGRLRNDAGERLRAIRTTNRVGVAAGRYFGQRALEGEVSYENRLYDRYGGLPADPVGPALSAPGDRPTYGNFEARFRFGDDFTDLSRTNFRVGIRGGHFRYNPGEGYSDGLPSGAITPVRLPMGMQNMLGGEAAIARRLGSHLLSLDASFNWYDGAKSLADNRTMQLRAGARYGFRVRTVDFTLGLDYYWLHDRWTASADNTAVNAARRGMRKNSLYFVPYARLRFDPGNGQFVPFAEVDGQVRENSFATLSRLNPCLSDHAWVHKSTVDYNVRLGVGGSLAGGKAVYRFYVGITFTENALSWYALADDPLGFTPATGRRNAVSFNGELEIRPVGNLLIALAAHGYDYTDRTGFCSGLPQFRADATVRYTHRKFALGLSAAVRSVRHWSVLVRRPYSGDPQHLEDEPFKVPFTIDLRAFAQWHVTRRTTLFVEGHNLADARLYEWPGYPEYGAGFTAGVKIDF